MEQTSEVVTTAPNCTTAMIEAWCNATCLNPGFCSCTCEEENATATASVAYFSATSKMARLSSKKSFVSSEPTKTYRFGNRQELQSRSELIAPSTADIGAVIEAATGVAAVVPVICDVYYTSTSCESHR